MDVRRVAQGVGPHVVLEGGNTVTPAGRIGSDAER